MDTENSEFLAGHAIATKVGGRRMSQNTGVPTMIKERESLSKKDKQDDEENSEQLLRQDDNQYMYEQLQRQQQNAFKQNYSKMNREIHRAPDPVKNNHIRQPARFPAGLPKETKMIMKEMKDN
ncbi:hypothetical protein LPJ57_009804 [Coemansia sp. RSA 486]|nr:hypothetical protein LPJ57_009804 [Coemansia sp. RSA 486]KAJ2230436.1 hypothetical protein IWW45_005802 [Coemansia sp. RSA 485]KAJ2233933.1 hypothetical protein IWW45_003804 [Coemansia sp. RSA 485]